MIYDPASIRVVPGGVRAVPLLLVLPYLIVTFLLFFLGPYVWPVREWWMIWLYVPLSFALLTLGFFWATNRPATGAPFKGAKACYLFGSLGMLALLTPTTLIYTDSWPWQIAGALADQKEAYSTLGEQLRNTQGDRGMIALVRAIVAPFAFCVLPLAVIYWGKLNIGFKALAVLVVMASIDLSILRGTTRELADLMIVGSSAYLVALGRSSIAGGYSLAGAIRRRWKTFILLPLFLMLVVSALIGRTEARLGGQNAACIPDSGVCVSMNEPYRSVMGDSLLFGLATVQGYLSQGYYGLSLAAEKDFETTLGIGHSPALATVYVLAGGDPSLLEHTYTSRARADGWSDHSQWSTLLVWIANDIGLSGALIFIWLVGVGWGRSWVKATQGRDDPSAVFFCVMMMMIFYLPANNQMMSTFDTYATLLFWWLFSTLRQGYVTQRRPARAMRA